MMLTRAEERHGFGSGSLVCTHVLVMRASLRSADRFDSLLLRLGGWFLVVMAVLLEAAVVVATALVVRCLICQDKRFPADENGVNGRFRFGLSALT